MAKMKRNVGDLVSGKLGNVVFVQMRNKSYVRTAPIRKKNSWSDLQVCFRKRIAKVANMWRSLKSDVIIDLWNKANDDMNGYAFFVKNNMSAISIDGQLSEPTKLIATYGNLWGFQNLQASRQNPLSDVINLKWENDSHLKPIRLEDSIAVIALHGEHFGEINFIQSKRKDLHAIFNLPKPTIWSPQDKITLFVFLLSPDGKCSISQSFDMSI